MPTPSPSNPQLGAAIRRRRKERKVSIEDLAARAGISWRYLSAIEKGGRNPSWDVVTAIADNLDLGIIELSRRAAREPN